MSERKETIDRRLMSLNGLDFVQAVQLLTECENSLKREGYTGPSSVRVETEYEYGDYYPYVYLTGRRMENDKEYEKRISDEKKSDDWERKQYETLRKKFEYD